MLNCPKCNSLLAREYFNTRRQVRCPVCKTDFRSAVYPAMYRPIDGSGSGELLTAHQQASCFFHQRKKAVVACSSCGRFLCALCDLDINGDHICPKCLQSGQTQRKLKDLENKRVCYDTIALSVAIWPMITIWLTIMSAPIAIYLSIRHWKSPSSIIPRTKVRFVAAIGIASMQIGGWILILGSAFLT